MPRDGRQRRREVVRHRSLLRLPSDEHVRRRRSRRVRRGAPSSDVRERAQRPERRRADARPVDLRPVERQGHRGASRRSRAGVPPPRRAPHRQAVPLRLHDGAAGPDVLGAGTSSTTSTRARSEVHDFGAGPHAAEPVFVPAERRRGRGRRLRDHVRLRRDDRTAATSSSSTRRTSRATPSPRSTCPSACRTASTATGCPTKPDRVRSRATHASPGAQTASRLADDPDLFRGPLAGPLV